jgi:hypothetical protein
MRPAYLIWTLATLWQPIVGGYSLAGPGATACGELADKFRLNPELTDAAMVLWTEGIMRAVSEASSLEAKRDLTLDKEQADLLRAYCDAHPFASFDQAMKNVYLGPQP